MKILICNAGSTSLKFKLWQMPEYGVLAQGLVERVGSENGIFSYSRGETGFRRENVPVKDYTTGISMFLRALTGADPDAPGAVGDLREIDAVGYKTVLSRDHYGVHELNEDTLQGMRDYFAVAPAHNGPYLEAISILKRLLPDARHIGVFETNFHRTIPRERCVFPIPYEWTEKYGIRRMGYHGASHGYNAERLRRYRRVISCHLGGSASICAILDGKSVDNSFGFSLQMGVPHASRTGDVDVYIVPYLMAQGLSIDEIYQGLGKNGGLRGISGTSGDMRDIEAAIAAGSDRAQLALDVYCTSILRYIGAYSMELGGLDAIAFTGGIGEKSARVRRTVIEGMRHLGAVIDAEANETGTGERRITAVESKIDAFVIPANEEYMVVRETYAYCQ